MGFVKRIFVIVLSVFLVAVLLTVFSQPKWKLRRSTAEFTDMVTGDIPDDLHLTIYYVDPMLLFRAPLGIEELKRIADTQIDVGAEELAEHIAVLRKLDPSALQTVQERPYIDARLVYVFEAGDDKLLEVTVCEINRNAYVNDIEVKHDPVLYELIIPFLSEEDREILGF